MLTLYLIARGGMGAGDVKLGALVGAATGLPFILTTLMVAFLWGGVTGLVSLALGVRKRKDAIPFGPYLAGAATAALFFADAMHRWCADIVFR